MGERGLSADVGLRSERAHWSIEVKRS